MMLGLGSQPISLNIVVARAEPCPVGSTSTEQRDMYDADKGTSSPVNICTFSSIEAKEAHLRAGYILGITPMALGLIVAAVAALFLFGGKR